MRCNSRIVFVSFWLNISFWPLTVLSTLDVLQWTQNVSNCSRTDKIDIGFIWNWHPDQCYQRTSKDNRNGDFFFSLAIWYRRTKLRCFFNRTWRSTKYPINDLILSVFEITKIIQTKRFLQRKQLSDIFNSDILSVVYRYLLLFFFIIWQDPMMVRLSPHQPHRHCFMLHNSSR